MQVVKCCNCASFLLKATYRLFLAKRICKIIIFCADNLDCNLLTDTLIFGQINSSHTAAAYGTRQFVPAKCSTNKRVQACNTFYFTVSSMDVSLQVHDNMCSPNCL